MSELFLKIMQMSLTASYVILAVLFIRLLKKAPKIFSYTLWAFVLFRLLCPITLESPFSLLPNNSDTAAISYLSTQLQDQNITVASDDYTDGPFIDTSSQRNENSDGNHKAVTKLGDTLCFRVICTCLPSETGYHL